MKSCNNFVFPPRPDSRISSHGRVSACGGFAWACGSERHPAPRRSRAGGRAHVPRHWCTPQMPKMSTSRLLPSLAGRSPKAFFCHCSARPKMGQWMCSKCKSSHRGFGYKRVSSFSCRGAGHKRGVGGQAQCAKTTLHHFSEREDCE